MSSPPPLPVTVEANGFLCAQPSALEALVCFDDWHRTACPHPNQMLILRHLGNMHGIGLVREAVSRLPRPLPVLSESVIYSGTHSGDWLPLERVSPLQAELDDLDLHLPRLSLSSRERESIQSFVKDLRELCAAAQAVKKPIAF